jgi:hypothetical protein
MRPRQRNLAYRGHEIVLLYVPADDEWRWVFKHVHRGTNSTEHHAEAVAKRRIDKLLEKELKR